MPTALRGHEELGTSMATQCSGHGTLSLDLHEPPTMPQRNLFILLAAVALSLVCYARSEQNPYGRYVSSAYREISERALDDVPDQLLFESHGVLVEARGGYIGLRD